MGSAGRPRRRFDFDSDGGNRTITPHPRGVAWGGRHARQIVTARHVSAALKARYAAIREELGVPGSSA